MKRLHRRLLTVAPVLALAGALAAPSAAPVAQGRTTTILPGYWESTSRISFGISSSDTERKCVRAQEIDRFFSGPSNRHYTCEYPVRQVANGQARFEGTCVSNGSGRVVQVAVSGTYAPEEFELSGRLRTRIAGLSVAPTGSIRARRLSASCPAGAETF